MASFEDDEHRVLIALYIESQKPSSQLLGLSELADQYNVHVSLGTLRAVAGNLESQGYSHSYQSWDDLYLGLKDAGLRPVLNSVLTYLNATCFDVSWKHERITTDALKRRDIPGRDGWTMLYWENEDRVAPAPAPAPAPANSAEWLGVPWPEKRSGPATVAGDYIVHNHAVGSSGHVYKGSPATGGEGIWAKWGVIVAAVALAVALAAWLFGDNLLGR